MKWLKVLIGMKQVKFPFNAKRSYEYINGFSYGELIAQPVLEVEEGETTGGFYSVPGESQYTFVVLVRPAADDQVFISLQFSSGNLNIQPNLLVDIDKQMPATIDKVRMVLRVQNVVRSQQPEQIAFHD